MWVYERLKVYMNLYKKGRKLDFMCMKDSVCELVYVLMCVRKRDRECVIRNSKRTFPWAYRTDNLETAEVQRALSEGGDNKSLDI